MIGFRNYIENYIKTEKNRIGALKMWNNFVTLKFFFFLNWE